MNYQLHYDRLIERARNRTLDGYKESHHVAPRCMNGSDDKDNLVDLTAREHFIAHLLLVKIFPKQYGLIKAVNMMCIHQTENRSMNRMYGWLKEKFSSEMSRSQSACNNTNYGMCWVSHVLLEVSFLVKKENLFEYILEGFIKKRIINFSKHKKSKQRIGRPNLSDDIIQQRIVDKIRIKNEKIQLKLYKKDEKINYYINLFDKFKESKNSLKEFCIHEKIYYPHISKMFLKKFNFKEIKIKNTQHGHKKQTGELNSQHGTKFMFNEELKIEKRIKKDDIETYILSGWKIGQLPIYCEKCNCKLTKMRVTSHKCNM